MRFGDMVREHQRLLLLRALADQPSYAANDAALQRMLDAFGLAASLDQVRSLLSWLADQALVTLTPLADAWVVQVTQAGIDAAQGRSTVPGVQRPAPDTVGQAALRAAIRLPGA